MSRYFLRVTMVKRLSDQVKEQVLPGVSRYFLRVTMVKRLSDQVKEQDLVVHTLAHYPDQNSSIKMEVGIEDCLHIEFEYNKSK